MAGVVVETDYGIYEFPKASQYDDDPDSGVLDITDADGRYLATFNRGQWWNVRYVEDTRRIPEPYYDDVHDFVYEEDLDD